MLSSSSSQYLHPDYLQPLPTTLDAKKSPLALLAQTCSSIGKDSSSSSSAKSLIPPIERKDAPKDKDTSSSRPKSGADTPRTKSRDSSDRKSQLSPATKKPSGSPAPKDHHHKAASRSTPNKSPCHSPASKETRGECRSRDGAAHPATSSSPSEAVDSKPLSASQPFSAAQRADALASSLYSPYGMPFPGYPYPMLGHPLALDPSAGSPHPGLSKHSPYGWSGSGVSPYVGYTRVKSTTGASTLVPVCKDPSCNHCQSNVQSAQSTTCAAGCTQCTHDKTPTSFVHTAALGGLPMYPGAFGASPSSLHALSSLYAAQHPYGGMLPGAAQGLPPFICNWVAGADYCGKRFASSEELLQHLRTHTSASDSAAALSLAGLPYGGLGGFPGMPSPLPPPPGSLSPDSALRQAAHYPRSLSPSSLLAASRFHPYKSALSSLASPPSAANLAQFYSPLGLYGQRLGAAAP
ncbi:hypothetical protein CAPTEDRAFT_21565 [Capitella teleta]|uniref:C2H2-type domain-containing protein n=1 Tax=Capitella teleta TaxID=283909 RepID=R7U8C4_CAPTE|nr:hypothetical protein CAPTEDRAFT_21565 [Capitella teleta]|eukprot:ELT99926.1 hypothetical protein CAPTEDRAFT_21565 [Capitella teleta]